mmetsp:Transcript_7913/g.12122  ORF Transcript_7913/g.12122 Transcript_7913/m.12122 type:complete len:211 (+) Transcript_7913:2149-2781(+)
MLPGVAVATVSCFPRPARKAPCTISRAKNTPAIGALKPAETPAAAPQASKRRERSLLSLMAFPFDGNRKMFVPIAMPISTDGPSGPREHPVPRVHIAARALRKKSIRRRFTSNASDAACSSTDTTVPRRPGGKPPNKLRIPTTSPPAAGIKGSKRSCEPWSSRGESYVNLRNASMDNLKAPTEYPAVIPTSDAWANADASVRKRISSETY